MNHEIQLKNMKCSEILDNLDNVAFGKLRGLIRTFITPPSDNSGKLTLSYDKAGGYDEAEGFVAAWKQITISILRRASLASWRYRIFQPVA